jgi:hypothetical protein
LFEQTCTGLAGSIQLKWSLAINLGMLKNAPSGINAERLAALDVIGYAKLHPSYGCPVISNS